MKPFLFFHSWPYHLKYIIYLTTLNSVLNYFYLQSLPLQKRFFSFFYFRGKNNLEQNLFWLNVLCISNDTAMNERIKKGFIHFLLLDFKWGKAMCSHTPEYTQRIFCTRECKKMSMCTHLIFFKNEYEQTFFYTHK